MRKRLLPDSCYDFWAYDKVSRVGYLAHDDYEVAKKDVEMLRWRSKQEKYKSHVVLKWRLNEKKLARLINISSESEKREIEKGAIYLTNIVSLAVQRMGNYLAFTPADLKRANSMQLIWEDKDYATVIRAVGKVDRNG